MSGYFERLVERALGTAPLIEPRRAPRFESATAGWAHPGEPPADDVSTSERQDIRPVVSPASPAASLPGPTVRQERRLSEDYSAGPAPALVPPSRAHPAGLPPAAPVHSPAVTAKPPVASTPPDGGNFIRIRDTDTIGGDARLQPLLPPGVAAPPRTASGRSGPLHQPAHSAFAPASRPAVARNGRDESRPPAFTRSSRRLLPPLAAEPQPPVPVKVTIGRIEVKAVREPAPPQAAAPPTRAPVLSLDDYLAQRDGGRR